MLCWEQLPVFGVLEVLYHPFGTLPDQCPLVRATGYSFLYRGDVEGEVLSEERGLEDNL